MRPGVTRAGTAAWAQARATFAEVWTRYRDMPEPTWTPVTLVYFARDETRPHDYQDDRAGTLCAEVGTLLPGDQLTHPDHGTMQVTEEGADNWLGVYESAAAIRVPPAPAEPMPGEP